MARVKRTTLVPWIAVVVPTAQMSVAETAEILDSTAFAKLVPDGTAGTGTGTTDQAVPSQCSASGRASLPWPTAQALAGLRSATSYSDASLPPLAAAGVGTMVHAVPFQCAARVLWLAALMLSFLVIWRSQVAAPLDCHPTRLLLHFDGQADAEMNVASGMPCALLVDTGPASIDTLAVEAAPANGYLNPRGRTGVIYRSAPWFKGEDDFTVALKGRVGSHRGAMQVHVRVTVQ